MALGQVKIEPTVTRMRTVYANTMALSVETRVTHTHTHVV